MAKWRPMTENQKRQQKAKIKKLVAQDYPMGLPREKKRLSRNRQKKGQDE
jgi:hypothetical protein